MVDFKYISKKFIEKDKSKASLCNEIRKAREIVDSIILQYDSCDKCFNEKKLENISEYMKLFNDNLNKLQVTILLIIQNYFPKDNIDWQKMLILLRSNQADMNIFQESNQNSTNNQQEMQFHYSFQVIQYIIYYIIYTIHIIY